MALEAMSAFRTFPFEVQLEYLQLRGSHAVADTDQRLRHLITFQVDHVEHVA
jgi:hypothetical protein